MKLCEQGWRGFIEMCLNAKDEETIQAMFSLFLTPEEKVDIARRFLIIKELVEGNKTQRDIAKDLNVSIAKITRGSNELKRMSKKWRQFLNQVYGVSV